MADVLNLDASSNGLPVYTHYAYVHDQQPTYRRFFGDTHFHTGARDGNAWTDGGDHLRAYTYFRAVGMGRG